MKHSYKDFYHKICEIVELKDEAMKQLKMLYLETSDKPATLNGPRQMPSVLQHPPDDTAQKEERLETWLSKWEVMAYLKISKTTYYRWRKDGKLVPRNGVGEDRYLWDDVKDIVKKRMG